VSPTTGKEQFPLNTYALVFFRAAIVFSSLFRKIAVRVVIIIHRSGALFGQRCGFLHVECEKLAHLNGKKIARRIPLAQAKNTATTAN
jgi:hypothetical protein